MGLELPPKLTQNQIFCGIFIQTRRPVERAPSRQRFMIYSSSLRIIFLRVDAGDVVQAAWIAASQQACVLLQLYNTHGWFLIYFLVHIRRLFDDYFFTIILALQATRGRANV